MKRCIVIAAACFATAAAAQQKDLSFFVTSTSSGKGADLGGLAGADKLCQSLAEAAGAGGRTWHAYLSTQGDKPVNARDRIGKGPWRNAKGEVIAKSVEDLHSQGNKLNKQSALTEKGAMVNGRGDTPNMHDVLTGSQPDGRAFPAGEDRTCGNWTKGNESGGSGAAMVGHHDRIGLRDDDASKSWNSSHPSRGCSYEALKSSGGDGRLYCFAVK